MSWLLVLVLAFSLSVLGLSAAVILWYKKWHYMMKNVHFPGPTPLPLIGCAADLGEPTKIFWKFYDWLQTYGNNLKGSFGFDMLIGVTDPEYIEFICTSGKTQKKGEYYRYLHNWLGTGLLTSHGEKWRKRRKMITPAYHFQILENFIEVFEQNGNILINKLRQEVGKLSFEVGQYVTLCALDSINETAMGVSVNAQDNSNTDYINAIREMTRIVVDRAVVVTKHFDFLYQFTEDYRLEQKCLQILHNYTLSVIEVRRLELLKNPERFDPNAVDEFGKKKRMAFLDLLLQATIDGKPLTNSDIREEVDTFMLEGHDTVSTSMCFWLHLISKHPDVQHKLIEEQRRIFGPDPTRPTTYGDLQLMQYMEMTIKEALRLYPSVPIMARDVVEDFEFDDHKVKKGTQILLFPFYTHRRPDLYPEPEKFIPERFSAEQQRARHPFAYLAFSAGFRNCIGQRFAMLEMKSTLSKIMRHFEICSSRRLS